MDLTVIVVVLCVPAYYENEQVLECVWCGPTCNCGCSLYVVWTRDVIVVVLCVAAYYENEQVLECVWCGPNV